MTCFRAEALNLNVLGGRAGLDSSKCWRGCDDYYVFCVDVQVLSVRRDFGRNVCSVKAREALATVVRVTTWVGRPKLLGRHCKVSITSY
jgi:hypothetical protein